MSNTVLAINCSNLPEEIPSAVAQIVRDLREIADNLEREPMAYSGPDLFHRLREGSVTWVIDFKDMEKVFAAIDSWQWDRRELQGEMPRPDAA